MAAPTGLDAQLGHAAESTYGTYVAPTRFPEFVSESLKLAQERIVSKGIRAGTRVLRTDRSILNRKGVKGDINYEVAVKGFGILFKHAGLPTVATTTAGTLGKRHRFTLGDYTALSMTTQVGRPDINGTVLPYTYLGCKVTDWELSCDVDGIVMFKNGIDGRDEDTAQTLAVASVPSADLFTFLGGVVKIAGTAYDATKFSLKCDNKLNADRYFLKGSSLKSKPLVGDLVELSGEVEVELSGSTLYNLYRNGTDATLQVTFTGAEYEATFPYKLDINLAAVQFTGETPNVGGTDIVTHTLPFTVVTNVASAEPITLDYYTTDTLP